MSAIARLLATGVTAPLNALGGYGLAFPVAAILAGGGHPAGPACSRGTPACPGAHRRGASVGSAPAATCCCPRSLSAVAHYVLMGLVYGFVPLLAKQLGAPDAVVSNLTVVHLAVFTPSVLAAAFLLRRFDARPLVLVSFVALSLGALAAHWQRPWPGLWPCRC